MAVDERAEGVRDGWDAWEQVPSRSRARRAVAVIAVSLVAVSATAAAYLHPLVLFAPSAPGGAPAAARYSVTALDFVSPDRGWFTADMGDGTSALLRTTDGAATWTQLAVLRTDGQVPYLKFFDDVSGVIAVTGSAPFLARTFDAGRTWSAIALPGGVAAVLSWSFVDMENGWLLATDGRAGSSARLWRTDDDGLSWTDLGAPVGGRDQAFTAQMAFLTTGWLATVGSGAYAYRSVDFGATWSRVRLPVAAPAGASGGRFFVAVEPLGGLAAIASVVYLPPIRGRSGVGAMVLAFPPLTVRVYDGGKPAQYTYATALATAVAQPAADAPVPGETLLRTLDGGASWSVITPPMGSGALAAATPTDWWWIGTGEWAGSADGGATWNMRRRIGAVGARPGLLRVLDPGHAWFAGSLGTRPVLEETDNGGRDWRIFLLPAIAPGGYALT